MCAEIYELSGRYVWDGQSQQLAEAAASKETLPFEEAVPSHYHSFRDVLSKESFDTLPERCRWDHAIKLQPGELPGKTKLIQVSPLEQAEINKFLDGHNFQTLLLT